MVINIETHRYLRTKEICNKFKIKLKGNLKAYTIKDYQIFLFKRELKIARFIVLLSSFFDDFSFIQRASLKSCDYYWPEPVSSP